jgi:hypothetical protein
MYWFVIYAARSQTRARSEAPHVDLPGCGSWLECPYPAPAGKGPVSSPSRYTALLADTQWTELCEELALDLDSACLEEGRCGVCEAGPLPAVFVEETVPDLPGIDAVVLDMRECVVGPVAAIALELPGPPGRQGAATGTEVGLCVAPLPESEAEREQVRSLFATVAFNVGGADAELRCPDCASPELRWLGGPVIEQQMGCDNCGARLPRASALLRVGDCEEILASAPSPGLAAAAAVGPTPAPSPDLIQPVGPGAEAPEPARPRRRQP